MRRALLWTAGVALPGLTLLLVAIVRMSGPIQVVSGSATPPPTAPAQRPASLPVPERPTPPESAPAATPAVERAPSDVPAPVASPVAEQLPMPAASYDELRDRIDALVLEPDPSPASLAEMGELLLGIEQLDSAQQQELIQRLQGRLPAPPE